MGKNKNVRRHEGALRRRIMEKEQKWGKKMKILLRDKNKRKNIRKRNGENNIKQRHTTSCMNLTKKGFWKGKKTMRGLEYSAEGWEKKKYGGNMGKIIKA